MSRPLAQGSSPPTAAGPGTPEYRAPDLKSEPGTRVLKCADADGSSSFYAVDDMTRKLARFPSLAAYVGLSSVSNCDEAISFARGYNAYAARNPGFEQRPDPKWAGNAPAVDDVAILPRIKILHGDQVIDWAFPTAAHPDTSPGPIVKIRPVTWWPNGQENEMKKHDALGGQAVASDQFCEAPGACTASFVNRNWLLTAAHCLQNVNKFPVTYEPVVGGPGGTLKCHHLSEPDPDRPGRMTGDHQDYLPGKDQHTPMKGVARYIIFWPVTGDFPSDAEKGVYSVESTNNYYGVALYQFPKEEYDPTQFRRADPNDPTLPDPNDPEPDTWAPPVRHGPDVALLAMNNWTSAAAYMTPDLDNEGAMYIAKESGSGPTGRSLVIAGYGVNPDVEQEFGKEKLYWNVLGPGDVRFRSGWEDTDADNNRFGGFGSAVATYQRSTTPRPCSGDSGGALYSVFTPTADGPQKFIAYAVLSHGATSMGGCAPVGGSDYWSRLELDNRIKDWMNDTFAEGPLADTKEEQLKYNRCQEENDPVGGRYYKCWGEPCDGAEGSSLSCPQYKTCVGSGRQLNEQRRKCYGCPTTGDCSCIRGYCMWDIAKLTAAGLIAGGEIGGAGGAGGTGGGGGSGGTP
jgi:hypothetical protein